MISPYRGTRRVRGEKPGEEFYRYNVARSEFQGHGMDQADRVRSDWRDSGLYGQESIEQNNYSLNIPSEALDPLITYPTIYEE